MKFFDRSTSVLIVFFCITSLSMAQTTAAKKMRKPQRTSVAAAPIDLGTLGGSSSQANAIGLFGSITGQASVSGDAASHAFLRSPGSTTLQDLGTLYGGTNSVGLSTNLENEVVGYSDYLNSVTGFVETDPFLYNKGSLIDLGTLGGAFGEATGVNNLGVAVGYSLLSDQATTHAFAYTPQTKGLIDLGTLNTGINSEAFGVNDLGLAVGFSETGKYDAFGNPTQDAVIFNIAAKKIVDLGTAGGTSAQALAINDFVQLVGTATTPAGNTVGFYYNAKSAQFQSINGLGGSFTQPTAISIFGEVVGNSNIAADAAQHAFMWTPRTGTIDLNSVLPANSGWVLTSAQGVNYDGTIVGQGVYNGQNHAYSFTYLVTSDDDGSDD